MDKRINNMKYCKECGGKIQVINCRTNNQGAIVRRRKCKSCGDRFSTIEIEASRYKDGLKLNKKVLQLKKKMRSARKFLEVEQ